jgi:serine/threonine-protein kinase
MKSCPQCGRIYEQEAIRFCLDDGVTLIISSQQVTEQRVVSVAATGGIAHDTEVAFGATIAPAPTRNENTTDIQVHPSHDDGLPPGTKVGEYVIERKIGEGGMGMIFGASHPIIGKQVAIKVLNPAMAATPDVVNRFIQEAKSVNQIRHRNIVDIFSFGILHDGRHYFAMEFLEGESLAHRLQRARVDWPEAVQIWLQITSAIEAAHKHEIVHRDLKPDNVFLTPSADGPFVKVLDFGIAKLLGDGMGMTKTSTGMPIGTPTYMSPEQAAGAKVDARTDIYALGVIFYEMIAGRPPFVGETVVKLLHDHMNEPPPPLETVVEKCDAELRMLVTKMLEKEPADRPPNMTVVRDELVRLRDLAMSEGKPLYGDAMPLAAKRTKKKAPVVAVIAAVAGIAVIGVAAVKLTEKAPAPVVVTPPPIVITKPAEPSGPKPGKLLLSTNAMATRLYLDKSATEKATDPVAAGGNNLHVQVPPNVDWILRVEAEGFKPLTMPFKIGEGVEQALPVVLTPDVKEGPHKPHSGKAAPAPVVTPTPQKPKPVENGKFLDPFGRDGAP